MDKEEVDSIFNGIKNVEDRLDRDVAEMCSLLEAFAKEIFVRRERVPENDLLKEHFHEIYKSLKLHLVFHSGADLPSSPEKLNKLGGLIKLNDEELQTQPDENSALEYCADPWSKLLEFVSGHFRIMYKFSLSTHLMGSYLYNGDSLMYTRNRYEDSIIHATSTEFTQAETDRQRIVVSTKVRI